MSAQVLVVGSLNLDLVARVHRHPQPGETVLAHHFAAYPGGKGANQAVAAARLGAEVTLVGRLGKDTAGETLRHAASAESISTAFIYVDEDAPTGQALIVVDDLGENTIVVVPGANGHVSPADLERASQAFDQAAVLVLQLEIPVETVLAASQMAAQRHIPVILNPAPAQALPRELLHNVSVLVPNRSELFTLAGDASSLEQALVELHRQGPADIVVTLGKEGALWDGQGVRRQFAAFPVEPVDTVAAGDAFTGALAVALAEGRSMEEAILWGNAAGALAVTRHGAQPSLPRRDELERLLHERSNVETP